MPFLSSNDSSPRDSLRLPAQIRMSTPASQRLTTITEGPQALDPPPPIPRRSSRRKSASHSEANSRRHSRRWSASAASERTAPPPYEWKPEPIVVDDSDVAPDARLEKLRDERRSGNTKSWKRGGWVRLLVIAVVVVVILGIALGVGLGIGLKRRNGDEDRNDGSSSASKGSDPPPQDFPLGQYSFDMALRSVSTACTSNPATWRCFPYYVYSSDGSTNDTSLATFNWIISNSSATYATSGTPSSASGSIAANLTVSTTENPFSIMFKDKPLTYLSDSTNSTSPRYTFDFTMPRRVVPSPAITSDGTNAECFFNQTVYSASIYLAAGRSIYIGGATDTFSPGGYEPWPFAVEIKQIALGGEDVPDCYRSNDGQLGDQITNGLVPQPSDAECVCDYRNY